MNNKQKLLIVSSISPFPRTSGGALRIYNTIKYLSDQLDLYLIFFLGPQQKLTKKDLAFLRKHTKYFTIFCQKSQKNHFSFFNNFQPYWFSDWYDDELIILLPNIIKQYHIHNIQLDCTQILYLSKYLPDNLYKIFVAYDISTISFWRRLSELRSLVQIVIHSFRWLEVFFFELFYLSKFNLIIAMSSIDQSWFKKIFRAKNTLVIPNGVSQTSFLKKKPGRFLNLGYIGSFNHPPNRSAIKYFISEIAPILEKKRVKFRYYIVGANNPRDVKNLIENSTLRHPESIINLGRIPYPKKFYQLIDILIAPIFSGSGTRVKILEALSYGIPVITTTVGSEGINISNRYLKTVKGKNQFVRQILHTKNDLINQSLFNSQDSLKQELSQYLWSTNIKHSYSDLFK